MRSKAPKTLDEFCGYCAHITEGVDEAVAAMAMAEDPDGVIVASIKTGDSAEALGEAFEQLLVGGRRFMAMATRVNWSPDEGPTTLSWLVVAVSAEETAQFFVKQNDGDKWWRLGPMQAPWFALSTAGSLRKKLQGDPAPLTIRGDVQDPRLFSLPSDGTPPPLYPDGKL